MCTNNVSSASRDRTLQLWIRPFSLLLLDRHKAESTFYNPQRYGGDNKKVLHASHSSFNFLIASFPLLPLLSFRSQALNLCQPLVQFRYRSNLNWTDNSEGKPNISSLQKTAGSILMLRSKKTILENLKYSSLEHSPIFSLKTCKLKQAFIFPGGNFRSMHHLFLLQHIALSYR